MWVGAAPSEETQELSDITGISEDNQLRGSPVCDSALHISQSYCVVCVKGHLWTAVQSAAEC